jgi:hypothetical protein
VAPGNVNHVRQLLSIEVFCANVPIRKEGNKIFRYYI